MLRLNTRIGGSDSTPTTAFTGPRRCRLRTTGVTTPALAPVHAQTRMQVRPVTALPGEGNGAGLPACHPETARKGRQDLAVTMLNVRAVVVSALADASVAARGPALQRAVLLRL